MHGGSLADKAFCLGPTSWKYIRGSCLALVIIFEDENSTWCYVAVTMAQVANITLRTAVVHEFETDYLLVKQGTEVSKYMPIRHMQLQHVSRRFSR